MKNSIKVLSIMLIILAVCSLFNIRSINGFFHDEEKLTDEIVFGDIETMIVEECDNKPIISGEQFKKIVKIKNTGESPCFVRVKVLISPEKYKNELALDINTTDWEYKDGYYYYKKILNCNDETTPLFTKLTIPTGLKNGDIFDINIYSESIQHIIRNKDNTIVSDYLEIFEKI